MSLLDRAIKIARSVATDASVRRAARDFFDSAKGSGSSGGKRRRRTGASRRPSPTPRTGSARGTTSPRPAPSGRSGPGKLPGPNDIPVPYDVARYGLPDFTYDPEPDDNADPGEVVWTWVPYEEDDTQGKDRPVLALARIRDCVVIAQMTSKDHDKDAAQEARWGRHWFDIGSGPWDSKGRDSEVRIDRLLLVHANAIRREGARLDKTRFTQVVKALRSFHGR